MVRTIEVWSAAQKKVATWNVRRDDDDVIVAEILGDDGRPSEQLRFSPNTTDEELANYVKQVNRRQNHDLNAPEVE